MGCLSISSANVCKKSSSKIHCKWDGRQTVNMQRWIREKTRKSECFFWVNLIAYYRKKDHNNITGFRNKYLFRICHICSRSNLNATDLIKFFGTSYVTFIRGWRFFEKWKRQQTSFFEFNSIFSLFENFTVTNRSAMALFSQRRARTNDEWKY